jgi:SAM-dependent MidA family methyltransferase
VVTAADQGTLRSLGAPPPRDGAGAARVAPDAIANRETFGECFFPPELADAAVRTFPTFEAYMDAALHDERWGYYGHSVSIGETGHFNTNPEDLSPHYGRWAAMWAFEVWREMIARGELTEDEPFPIVEFGAGNVRLARDFLDHLARGAGPVAERAATSPSRAPALAALAGRDRTSEDPEQRRRWALFADRAAYRIYETSASLRTRQRDLLGTRATVAEGDARRPAETLKRDFPAGLRGFVLTNEVPDAFGVHKVLLSADGDARVALVVPRVEPALRSAGGEAVARAIDDADAAVRATFGLGLNPGDFYLDHPTYRALMDALVGLAPERREALLAGGLWFEEAYVPAAAVPEVAAHLRANAGQYAIALAAGPSGVVTYVNLHAARFMRALGTALAVGFVLTIDYGETTWGLVQGARQGDFHFRVYGPWQDFQPRPNDPYAAPGTQDLTADVNFTDLAAAAGDAGLQVVHFGPERNLIGDELTEVVRAAADDGAVAEFVGNPVFKLLLLATRPSTLFSSPLLSPLPLTRREQDLPRSLRARVPAIEQRLISAPATER